MKDDEEDVEAECEGLPQQQEMDFTPNTFPPESLFPTVSTPLPVDSLTFDDDVKEKSQIDSEIYTPKIDAISVVPTAIMSTINHATTKSLKPTSVNQPHSTISSLMPLTMQLPKGISIFPCNFPVGLSAFTQNHSWPSNLQSLSECHCQYLQNHLIGLPFKHHYSTGLCLSLPKVLQQHNI
ncbi:hypothetical protein A2U01_0030522 [Trifolium medium]|uniref:Uncharacterized protein n=1 Tax=Trifolium medium TaxID=97028 RepID=A0A392PDP2_9FABA|nr:hypothetical protein [Trifolium medium]